VDGGEAIISTSDGNVLFRDDRTFVSLLIPIYAGVGNAYFRPQSDIPGDNENVSDAAFPDIDIFYTYIVLHVFTVPTRSKLHTNSPNPLG